MPHLKKLKEVDNKFIKFAKNDYVIELNAKLELAKTEMTQLAKVDYVTEQIDALSNEIREAISEFVTVKSVEQHFGIYDAKLK